MGNNAEEIIGNLFNECFHSLVFKSFGIVNNYDLAKDIVQDVFVKIWQNYQQIKHIDDLKPYIFKAVQNSSVNYLRDHNKKDFNKPSVADLNLEYSEVSDEIEDKELIYNKIHEAIDKLPEKWHKAFILSKYDKLKYYEIAEKMDISIKTVEKYISKALNFIRLETKSFLIICFLVFFGR